MKPAILSVFSQKELTTGGHKRYIGLLRELKARGYTVYFFSPVNFLDLDENYFHIQEPVDHIIPKSIQTLFSVKRKFKKESGKFSSINTVLGFGFSNIFTSLYLKSRLNVPLIFSLRSNVYEYRKIGFTENSKGLFKKTLNKFKKRSYLTLFGLVEKFVYRKIDKIVVQNKEDGQRLINSYGIKENKIKVIPNNINFLNQKEITIKNKSTKLDSIIFVGSLSRRKGILLLLKAVNKLNKKNIDVKLNILGDGRLLGAAKGFVRKNSLEDAVKFHGFVGNPLQFIVNSDLMVVPSIADSFPNTVLEALQVGTPVIGSNVGGIANILHHEDLLFEPGDVKEMENKITELLDPSKYMRAKEKCIERRDQFVFDWAGEFEKIILKEVQANKSNSFEGGKKMEK